MKKIPVSKPDLSGNELKYVTDCIESGWVSCRGPYVTKFEEAWAKYNGYKYGVSTSSGTTALLIALRAIGVGEGDEVIVPEFTMIATAWAVEYTRATPVFVDCDSNGLMTPEDAEEKITSKTKAIIPVNIYGNQCDYKGFKQLAHDYNLRIVEDAAESHGIKAEGDIACYSLFGNKIITSGEGGICLTNDKHLYEQMFHLKEMAYDDDHTFLHKKLGYNFRMTNMQAAVALAQVERIDELLAKRRQVSDWYDKELNSIESYLVQPLGSIVVWYYCILVENREGLLRHLEKNGVEARRFFKPMSMQPMYLGEYKRLRAHTLSETGIQLPTYPDMKKEDVKYVCNIIKEFYSQ